MNVRSSLIFDRSYPFFYLSDVLCYTVKNERINEMILSKKISKKITDILVTNEIIESQKKDIYFYCLDFALDLILFNCSLLLIGGLLDFFLPSLVYIIILVPIRMLAGGAHAKSPYSCFLLSYSLFSDSIFIPVTIFDYARTLYSSYQPAYCYDLGSGSSWKGITSTTPLPKEQKSKKYCSFCYSLFTHLQSSCYHGNSNSIII